MEDYVRQLQEAEKAGLDVAEALKQAQKETKTLDQAIKVATIQSDLKKYREAVKDQSFSGLKSVAQSARHLKSAFSELQKRSTQMRRPLRGNASLRYSTLQRRVSTLSSLL